MTTGTVPALPLPDNQPPLTPAADGSLPPAALAEAGLHFTSPQPADVDDVELNEAKGAAKAEETAPKDPANPDPITGAQPPTPAAAAAAPTAQPQPGHQPDTVMIPKARLDEALNGKREAELLAARLQGQVEALAATRQPAQAGQPGAPQPQQTAEQKQIAAIHQKMDAFAKQFDEGEISMADFKKHERDLNRQEAALTTTAPQPQQAPQQNDQLYLDQLTTQLETQHPWADVFTKVGTDADWDYLKANAITNLTARGVDPTNGSIGKYELRKEIAELCDRLGPTLVADRARAQGITLPGQPPAAGGAPPQPALSPEAKARAAALDKAAGAPPNLAHMTGSAGDPQGAPSEARLDAMTDEEIANLPLATRQKMMGISH